jgi:ABC-2 type transport system permease protein
MKAFRALYLANVREFVRDRTALFLTVVFPVLFILIFGLIFSRDAQLEAKVGIVLEDEGSVAQQLATMLERLPGTERGDDGRDNPYAGLTFERGERAALQDRLKRGDLDAVVIIPAGTSEAVLNGQRGRIDLQVDTSQQSTAAFVQSLVGGVVEHADRMLTKRDPMLQIEVRPVLAVSLRPLDYLIPGILAMSIMNLGLFATAQPLIALRTQGVLKRLGATPLPPSTLLAAYVALRLTTALVQTTLIVSIGVVLFDVAMLGNWLMLGGWVMLGALTFIAIGFFVAAIARTEESGTAFTNLVNLPMLVLSGVFFPVSALPDFLRPLVRAMPLTYVADALRQTMLDAPPINAPWINLAVLVAWLIAMTGLAVRYFRWDVR